MSIELNMLHACVNTDTFAPNLLIFIILQNMFFGETKNFKNNSPFFKLLIVIIGFIYNYIFTLSTIHILLLLLLLLTNVFIITIMFLLEK